MRVGIKIIGTVIGLYVAGYMLTIIGTIMNATCSPFYEGLTLIGWTVETGACNIGGTLTASQANTITSTAGTGILSVIGLLAIVWILFEFVDVRM